MKSLRALILIFLIGGIASESFAAPAGATTAEVMEQARPVDWRPLDPENTLYMELAAGRVIIELASEFAPNHVANVKALARERYFDGLAIIRAQDNYVAQWGDPNAEKTNARPIKHAKKNLSAEFDKKI